MGKKGGWFSAVKKAFTSESKKDQKPEKQKSKKGWLRRQKDTTPLSDETSVTAPPPQPQPPIPTIEDIKSIEAENEQCKHAYSVALATKVAAEAAVAAAQAAAEVVRLTAAARYSGKSKEEIAAIRIQTAFRGHMAKRALRALRGLVRLKSMIQGKTVKRQATSTLRCMQTLAHVQSQIRERRIRMSEENQALQRQIQQKHEKELEKLRASMGEDWNDSTQSKEQIEARVQNRQEAAVRRERALAYAFSHQQNGKNSSKLPNPTFMDPNNPHWGWSWLERWMASRPWENRYPTDNYDRGSVKSMVSRSMSIGEISRTHSRRDFNQDSKPSTSAQKATRTRQSPSTPPSKAPSVSSVTSKMKPSSSKGSNWGGDEDSRSALSIQSERFRRHSIAGSSIRDDDSFTSTPALPSYMAPTKAASARARLPSPLGLERTRTVEKGSARKRLSFNGSPARRHSGPPKVDITPTRTNSFRAHTEQNGGNR